MIKLKYFFLEIYYLETYIARSQKKIIKGQVFIQSTVHSVDTSFGRHLVWSKRPILTERIAKCYKFNSN